MFSPLQRPVLCFVIAAVLVSCAPRGRRPSGDVVFRQEGIASWYGSKFHGRKTANGERYNMYGISAAHRTLPLGTVVRVTHTGNGRKVTLRINDRGPFVEGRIIDLSYGAARKLGMVRQGIADVVVEAFGSAATPAPLPVPGTFSLQVGSFLVPDNAHELEEALRRDNDTVSIVAFQDNRSTYYRVLVGRFSSQEAARAAGKELQRQGYSPFVVRVE
jgi:rare lipoprotein A